ncbi:hypothetical protein Pelo_7507 [Pelomyxa schiedti]|nr:hypothetical protein Pelo_7507 [Pelomyxa schiedti]
MWEYLGEGAVIGLAVGCAVLGFIVMCVITCLCANKIEGYDVKEHGGECIICNPAPKPSGLGLCFLWWPFLLLTSCCTLISIGLAIGLVLALKTQTIQLVTGLIVGVTIGSVIFFVSVTMLITWNAGGLRNEGIHTLMGLSTSVPETRRPGGRGPTPCDRHTFNTTDLGWRQQVLAFLASTHPRCGRHSPARLLLPQGAPLLRLFVSAWLAPAHSLILTWDQLRLDPRAPHDLLASSTSSALLRVSRGTLGVVGPPALLVPRCAPGTIAEVLAWIDGTHCVAILQAEEIFGPQMLCVRDTVRMVNTPLNVLAVKGTVYVVCNRQWVSFVPSESMLLVWKLSADCVDGQQGVVAPVALSGIMAASHSQGNGDLFFERDGEETGDYGDVIGDDCDEIGDEIGDGGDEIGDDGDVEGEESDTENYTPLHNLHVVRFYSDNVLLCWGTRGPRDGSRVCCYLLDVPKSFQATKMVPQTEFEFLLTQPGYTIESLDLWLFHESQFQDRVVVVGSQSTETTSLFAVEHHVPSSSPPPPHQQPQKHLQQLRAITLCDSIKSVAFAGSFFAFVTEGNPTQAQVHRASDPIPSPPHIVIDLVCVGANVSSAGQFLVVLKPRHIQVLDPDTGVVIVTLTPLHDGSVNTIISPHQQNA